MRIETVGIVGGGLMGSGIAEVCLRSGCATMVAEVDPAAADAARDRIAVSLDRAVERGKLEPEERDAVLARLDVTTDLDGLAGCDLVVEAVVEDLAVKRQVFGRLDAVLAPGALMASNTSSIRIADLASATGRPEQVVGLHFFNPAPVMGLVEVIPHDGTAPSTVELVSSFVVDVLGKTAVRAPDRAGFIVNALLVPYLLDAIRMLEAGLATADDIDAAMRLGAAHPMGPLALSDLIGLDTLASIAGVLYGELGEDRMAPPAVLVEMVERGDLGRKSGRGFFDY